MKLSIQTDILKNIVRTLSRVSQKKIADPSSSDIFIEVSSGKTSFKIQQFDFNVVYTAETEGSEDGFVSVPINTLDVVVETLIDTMTTITLDKKKLVIQTPSSTTDMYISENEQEEESLITKPDGESFTIEREILVKGFKNVHHASSESTIKPEIASVYMYTNNNSIYFVSTDAFRLAEMRFMLKKQIKDDVSMLIPEKNVSKILRVLESVSDVDINIQKNDNSIYLSTDNFIIKTNCVRGDFPNYKNIIPDNFDMTVTLLRTDIQNFLKKAKIFANKLNKLSFTTQKDTALLMEFGMKP